MARANLARTVALGLVLLFLAAEKTDAALFHETMQDHFDGSNDARWQQEYFVNDTFWKGPESGAPIFVCVGGEGPPLDESVTSASVHCNDAVEWLSETGALFFALQHRYYGCQSNSSACPVAYPIESVRDMRFLSSRQALQDLALFHDHMAKAYALTPANRWITFGGSYPGVLAGFARAKFPHLFFAAVSSSSPIFSRLEMPGYYNYVSRAFSEESVGGSKACRDKIALGHARIGDIFAANDTAALRKLEAKFSLSSDSLNSLDARRDFAGVGVADFPAQANDPTCTSPCCNIARICETMLDADAHADSIDALAAVRAAQQESRLGAAEPVPKGRQEMVLHHSGKISQTKSLDALETDLWSWQVCTEFGFLQTCDKGSECMFTQGLVTLDYMFSSSCAVYDFDDIKRTAAAIDRSNTIYGGYHIDTPRILWIGGTVDPWLALSVQYLTREQVRAGQRMLLVKGASHHAWTHPTRDDDQQTVVDARTYLRHVLAGWLSEGTQASAQA